MSSSIGSGGTGSASGKLCTLCGQDVSSKPRTKDARGRYFCKPCYDSAVASKHEKRAGVPLPKAAPVEPQTKAASSRANSLLNDEPIVLDDDVLGVAGRDDGSYGSPSVLEHLLESEPIHEPRGMICPSCRSKVAPGGFICTTCGFNLQTNEQAGAVRVKKLRPAGGSAWPMIVGITSIVFGAGGVLFYGAYLLLAVGAGFQSGNMGGAMVSIIPVGTLLTSLSAWLLRDGIRIVRRDAEGVKWVRFWALTKGLMYGSCFGLMMSVPPGPLQEAIENAPGGSDLTVSDIKSTILLLMLWYLMWPAFILVFFFVPRIQDDVEAWG